ncbi:MAG: substrate-binding domain-containing protein, partial [Victivallales bacterium]
SIRTSKLIALGKIDGIILEDESNVQSIRDLSRKIPLVLLNCPSAMENICDAVVPDNRGGIVKALNHLIGHGHSRIAFLGGVPPGRNMDGHLKDRRDSFENEVKSRDLPINHDFIKTPALKAAGMEETEKMISETLSFWMNLPERPTAVICYNDLYAALLLRAAAEKNIRIPERLSVIGTDNTNECEYTSPTLTSIDHNAVEMGRLAIELFLKRISSPGRAYIKTSCDSALIARKSTGPCGDQNKCFHA